MEAKLKVKKVEYTNKLRIEMPIKVQSAENKAEETAAAAVVELKAIEKKKYGAFKGILSDPDLKFDKKDVDNLKVA
jgi:hypothetical protein